MKKSLLLLPMLAIALLMSSCASVPFPLSVSFGGGGNDDSIMTQENDQAALNDQASFDATQNMINNDAAVNASQAAANP